MATLSSRPDKKKSNIQALEMSYMSNWALSFEDVQKLNQQERDFIATVYQKMHDAKKTDNVTAQIYDELQRRLEFFRFEPNDEFTRWSAIKTVEGFMTELCAKREIFQYQAVCDQTNNPPVSVDRNELIVDIQFTLTPRIAGDSDICKCRITIK